MKLWFTQIEPPPEWATRALAQKGWQCGHLPFRVIEWVDPGPVDLTDCAALIVTSKLAARWLMGHASDGRLPPIAAVGRSTSALLAGRALLFGDDPPPDSTVLASRIQRVFAEPNRFIWLRGDPASPVLAKALATHRLDQKIVYRTTPIPKNFAPLTPPCMVYFQAPSTVTDFQKWQRHPPARIGAIGPATRAALEKLGWNIDFTPSRPEIRILVDELPHAEAFKG